MSPHPLSLTDSQLGVVLDHAKLVPVHWRERFLSAIADHLTAQRPITDAAVQKAVVAALAQFEVAA